MQTELTRRHFVAQALLAASASACGAPSTLASVIVSNPLPEASAQKLPTWHGFNLLEKFNGRNEPFREEDFEWIAELGFNFVRLPMDYRGWIEAGNWTRFHEGTLKEVEKAVQLGEKYRIHVCLNFHRAPGYTVARPPEAQSVWKDEEALRVCALHWGEFARRFAGRPNRQLSFNLFNEPGEVSSEDHRRVVQRLVQEIRKHDSNRLIICDGRRWGRDVPEELLDLGVAGATRGYEPFQLTHYQANWVNGSSTWVKPAYPDANRPGPWTKEKLREELITPWKKLQEKGMGVVVGEFGCYSQSPHSDVLRWLEDCLAIWKQAGWGWSLWNFRGTFGILDSERTDLTYEDWREHKLDRAMLELLQKYLR
jgi:endoglucanase